ncbi:MAG: type II toxin-antitoxin system RnlB family antitoxin [Desulfobacterales bacterium]
MMSACYKIVKTPDTVYPYIVFATSYLNPLDQKEAIEKDLSRIGVKGKILFDLLLSHGNTPDRFFEAFFNGEKINETSIKNAGIISDLIREISLEFYHKQPQYLENSVLTKAQKFFIKRKKLF